MFCFWVRQWSEITSYYLIFFQVGCCLATPQTTPAHGSSSELAEFSEKLQYLRGLSISNNSVVSWLQRFSPTVPGRWGKKGTSLIHERSSCCSLSSLLILLYDLLSSIFLAKVDRNLDLEFESGSLHYKILQILKGWGVDSSQQRLFITFIYQVRLPSGLGRDHAEDQNQGCV